MNKPHYFLPILWVGSKRYRIRARLLPSIRFNLIRDNYPGEKSVIRVWFVNVLIAVMIDRPGQNHE